MHPRGGELTDGLKTGSFDAVVVPPSPTFSALCVHAACKNVLKVATEHLNLLLITSDLQLRRIVRIWLQKIDRPVSPRTSLLVVSFHPPLRCSRRSHFLVFGA